MYKNELLLHVTELCTTLGHQMSSALLHVNIEIQQLTLLSDDMADRNYQVSTSRFGIGNISGSNKTPTGLHRISEKIGDGAPAGRIFKDRLDTGINWVSSMNEENLILTRILRLEGLEPGKNKGPGIDSFDRYIYIHGTNREAQIGTPLSHGCICMKNNDIIDLFELVEEGTFVYID